MKKYLVALAAILCAVCAAPAIAQESWKRADSAHFTVYSDADEGVLVDYTRRLEKFDGLLRFWFDKPTRPDEAKLTVYLLDDSRNVGKLLGSRYVAGFYTASAEATFAVAPRDRGEMDGQHVLFREYAHHFMYRHFSAPVPAWLREGFAEFLGTVEFSDDGRWTYGALAEHRSPELRRNKDIEIQKLMGWPHKDSPYVIYGFYGWSWALTHMLYMDEDRGARIGHYLDRLSAGEETLEAAEAVFGNLEHLERRLERYVTKKMDYAVSSDPFAWSDEVSLAPVDPAQVRMIEYTLRRRGGHDREDTRDDLLAYAETGPTPAEALAEEAMRELDIESSERWKYMKKHDDAMEAPYFVKAEALADRALALDPANYRANIVKGRILSRRLMESRDTDAQAWKVARRHFQIANRTDPTNVEALFRFARSYVYEGREGEMMHDAYIAAFKNAPQVTQYRIWLAYDFARLGDFDTALGLIRPLSSDPHYPKLGRKVVERIEAMRESGAKFPELDYDDEYDGEDEEDDA